jgi:hypothetical protein
MSPHRDTVKPPDSSDYIAPALAAVTLPLISVSAAMGGRPDHRVGGRGLREGLVPGEAICLPVDGDRG